MAVTAAAAALRAAADVLTLASEGVAALVIAVGDTVAPADGPPEVRPGKLRLVPGSSPGASDGA